MSSLKKTDKKEVNILRLGETTVTFALIGHHGFEAAILITSVFLTVC